MYKSNPSFVSPILVSCLILSSHVSLPELVLLPELRPLPDLLLLSVPDAYGKLTGFSLLPCPSELP
jgi:hypothetical protein